MAGVEAACAAGEAAGVGVAFDCGLGVAVARPGGGVYDGDEARAKRGKTANAMSSAGSTKHFLISCLSK